MSPVINSLIACVRIPKSGSTSLARAIRSLKDINFLYVGTRKKRESFDSSFQYYRFLRTQLKNNYMKHGRFKTADINKLIRHRAKNGDVLIGGHFEIDYIKSHISRDVKIVTLIRNPVSRCISEYVYTRKGYLNKPAVLKWDSSRLGRVAGTGDFDKYLNFLLEQKDIYGNISSRYVGWDPSQNIKNFAEANILCWNRLERQDKFEADLSNLFNQQIMLDEFNKTKSSSIITPTRYQTSLIEKIYDFDMQLYELL